MTQQKFMWITNQVSPVGKITQGTNGTVSVDLRDNINIVHNYKKNNSVVLTFKDDQKKYLITSDHDLEEIYKLHLTHPNVEVVLRKYCSDHLKEI